MNYLNRVKGGGMSAGRSPRRREMTEVVKKGRVTKMSESELELSHFRGQVKT